MDGMNGVEWDGWSGWSGVGWQGWMAGRGDGENRGVEERVKASTE